MSISLPFRHSTQDVELPRWVVSRQLEKSCLELVHSSHFGPILAVRRALVMASLTVPARETCRTTLKPQQKLFLWNEHYRWRLRVGRGGLAGSPLAREAPESGADRERGEQFGRVPDAFPASER